MTFKTEWDHHLIEVITLTQEVELVVSIILIWFLIDCIVEVHQILVVIKEIVDELQKTILIFLLAGAEEVSCFWAALHEVWDVIIQNIIEILAIWLGRILQEICMRTIQALKVWINIILKVLDRRVVPA